ncbi:MAG: alpha-amylase family glycosyl hydrolase [Candidatus Krumholzibacteriia bacterium]
MLARLRSSLGRLGAVCLLALLGACAAQPPVATAPAPPKAVAPAPTGPVPVVPQQSWDDAVLYFVILDRFADGDLANDQDVADGPGNFHGGDLTGLIDHLDEITGLGCTALWITPVVQQIPGYVSGGGFFDWAYHGYWADDFYAIDPRFGTEAQLKALVDAAHARGLKVLLDVVYNHCGYDSHYIRDKGRAWLRFGSQCGDDDLTTCLSGLPDFKTDNPEVREYLLEAHLGLAERTGLDGFRLDTVKHVEHDFWRLHRERSRQRLGDDFYLIGEVWGGDNQVLDPWFEPDEMDAGFDFGFQGSSVGFVLGRGRPVAFDRYLDKREQVRPGHQVSHYLSSHDTDGAILTLGGDWELFRMCAALQMTARGIPCVFYGEEVGRRIGTWPENRTDMPWGDRDLGPGRGVARDEGLRGYYRQLIAIRRAHPSIWRGDRAGLVFGPDHFVFARHDPVSGDRILVAVNRAEAAVDRRAARRLAGGARDLLGGGTLAAPDGQLNLTIPRRSVLILAPDGR